MKKVNKRSMLGLLLIPMLLLSIITIAPATTNAAEDLGLTVDAAILIDADSGKFYMSKTQVHHLVLQV